MNNKLTRMHSSRMRTGRSLTVCRSLLPGGVSAPGGEESAGGVSAPEGCLLWGGVCSWGVSTPGGCLLLGVCGLFPGGSVCSQGGVYSSGVSAPGGVSALGGCVHRGCLLWGSAQGGVCSGGVVCLLLGECLLLGGVCSQGGLLQDEGCLLRGVSAPGGCLLWGWYPSMH